ncbi:MAG: hypothetical protein JRG73_17175 [Deltaproteobacteria bacterium]|nr:hypothetical protein [Deltaproteobacteria bacterium]MBW2308659.1 hypothetical protein [Deltaproteobacteria bacterium]
MEDVRTVMNSPRTLYERGVRVIEARIGLISNNGPLLSHPGYFDMECQRRDPQIWNLHTSFPAVEGEKFDAEMDSYMAVIDHPGPPPSILRTNDRLVFMGDVSRLEETCRDRRWTLFGNAGLFYMWTLLTLERCRSIYSFHASTVYREDTNELLVMVGGPGAGKTVLMLEALMHRGYQLFSTEMTHFRVHDDGVTFFKGSMFDNIRPGSLLVDFPDVPARLGLKLPHFENVWGTKIAVNFEKVQTRADRLENPRVIILLPRIETGRQDVTIDRKVSEGKLRKALFDNLGEKASAQLQLYDGRVSVAPLDTQALAQRRLEAASALSGHPCIRQAVSILCGPQHCWNWAE